MFNVDSSSGGLKYLTKIKVGLSHLAYHKFRLNFQGCFNSICSCGQEIETSTHFFLHCSNCYCARQTLFEKVIKIDSTIIKQNDQVITKLLLWGNDKLKAAQNISILASTVQFLQELAAQVSKKHVLNLYSFTSTVQPLTGAFLNFYCQF